MVLLHRPAHYTKNASTPLSPNARRTCGSGAPTEATSSTRAALAAGRTGRATDFEVAAVAAVAAAGQQASGATGAAVPTDRLRLRRRVLARAAGSADPAGAEQPCPNNSSSSNCRPTSATLLIGLPSSVSH